jgi:glycosyltransferase involved in cell wall biosynthesis
VQLAYVGQLIYRKGVDLLIRALQQIPPNLDWRLSVIGSGEMDAELRLLARELGVGSRIVFRGVVPLSQVPEAMCRSDLLLLPSRFDGWGAVVNESLMCGTPVLCSDRCGARDFLKEPWRGEVLSCGAMPAWAEALGRWIQKGPLPARERTRIAGWSRCIAGPEVARYFNAILKHVYQGQSRPAPPWAS